MTAPRKRKAPEKKPVRRPSGLVVRTTLAAGNLVAANPSFFGGIVAFGIIFSFVAANALWYQPRHPHPFLNTRDAFRAFQQAASDDADPAHVTTFKIERQSSEAGSDDVASVIAASGPTAAGFPAENPSSEMVLQIQQQLANLGFYDGSVDGQMGTKTANAITFYQNKNGMNATGEPSADLLAALRISNGQAAVVPVERPSGDVTTNSTSPDPVATAIEASSKPVVQAMIPPKPIPDAKPVKAVAVPKANANHEATQKPAQVKAPVAKQAADTKAVARAIQKAPPGKAAGMDIASIIEDSGQGKPGKAKAPDAAAVLPAKPAKVKSVDTAEALPAKVKSLDSAEALPAKPVQPVKSVKQAASAPSQEASTGKPSAKVLKIQQALTKFAYANVPHDGVAGPETKAAIRNFEKNYNLPVTGEPSDALLKKMKDVGVL